MYFVIPVPISLSFVCLCFLCSHWSLVDAPLIFFCPADHVPDWQPRVLLGMVEARSVNVKKTTTTTTSQKTRSPRKNTASKKPFVESLSRSRSWRISIYSSAEKDEGLHQPGYLLVSPFIVSDLHGRARCILLYDYLFFYDYTSF